MNTCAIQKRIPNSISVLRALLIIPIAYFYSSHPYGALLLLGFAIATDWLDGFLARILDAHSRLGALLDPLADKILYLGLLFVFRDTIPVTTTIFLFTLPSEVLLIAIRVWPLRQLLKTKIPATQVGKCKMVTQSAAIMLMLSGIAFGVPGVTTAGIALAFLAIPLSWESLRSHF